MIVEIVIAILIAAALLITAPLWLPLVVGALLLAMIGIFVYLLAHIAHLL